MTYRIGSATKEEWAARCKVAEDRVAELEEALEEIGYMGFDMPSTLDLTDYDWQRRRSFSMQQIARAPLKDKT